MPISDIGTEAIDMARATRRKSRAPSEESAALGCFLANSNITGVPTQEQLDEMQARVNHLETEKKKLEKLLAEAP